MTLHKAMACLASLLLTGATLAAQSRSKANDPDLKEIRAYRLNMDVVQRYVHAYQMVGTDAAAKKCFEKSPPGNAASLNEGEKQINACPAAVALLNSAGMKPREFLIVTAALIGDVMAVGMKKNGTIKEYPDVISPENAAFLEQNFDKIQKMLAPLTGDN